MAGFVSEFLENALADATLEDLASQNFIPRTNLALRAASQAGETSRLLAPQVEAASSRSLTDRLRNYATRAQENIKNFGNSRQPLKTYDNGVYRSTTQDLNPVYDAGTSSGDDVLYNRGYNRIPNSDKYNEFSSSSESTRSVPLKESVLRNNVINNSNRKLFSIGGTSGSDIELQPLNRQSSGSVSQVNETSFGRGNPQKVPRLTKANTTRSSIGVSQRLRNLGSRVNQSINRNVRSIRNSLQRQPGNVRGNLQSESGSRSSSSTSSGTRPKRIVRRTLNQRPRSLAANRMIPAENSGRFAWDNTGMGSDTYFANSDSDVNRALLPKRAANVRNVRARSTRTGRGGRITRNLRNANTSSGLTDAVLGPLLYSSVFGDRR